MNPKEILNKNIEAPPTPAENPFKHAFRNKDKRPEALFEIEKFLIEKHYIKTISSRKTRELFLYQDGVYIFGDDILKREIQEMLEELCTSHHIKEIIEAIKNKTVRPRKDFAVDKNLVNLGNGVLDITTGVLTPHNPDNLFFIKIPVIYDPDKDCPEIKKFLSQILDKDSIPVIQEWFGYTLYRTYFIKKAMILVGEGDTGKTTLLRLLERFIGSANVCGVSLQKISADKFAAANFYNKHVNIYDDLSFKDISDNGAFKIATGGGSITGEQKFSDQFQFENFAKLTFACNKIPDVKDANDAAYFGRWIVINFRNVVEHPDKFLIDKITTPDELSGLLNFAVEGLIRILIEQRFSYNKEPHEIKTEMELSGSVIAQFAHHMLLENVNAWVSKVDMYAAFVSYARAKHLPVDTLETFGKKIANYADYIMDSRSSEIEPFSGKRMQKTGWRNVEIKKDPNIVAADEEALLDEADAARKEIASPELPL